LPRGVKLSVQQAELSEPVMRRERRWEAGNLHPPALIQEGGRIRIWYMAFASRDDPCAKAGNIPGKAPTLWCYAESTDGFHGDRRRAVVRYESGGRERDRRAGFFQLPVELNQVRFGRRVREDVWTDL